MLLMDVYSVISILNPNPMPKRAHDRFILKVLRECKEYPSVDYSLSTVKESAH